jgi:hypothetical protein
MAFTATQSKEVVPIHREFESESGPRSDHSHHPRSIT